MAFRGFLLLLAVALAQFGGGAAWAGARVVLGTGWSIQSSAKIEGADAGGGDEADGKRLSQSDADTDGWLPARVPSSVVAAQVARGLFQDPYFGINIRALPGTDYPIASNFSNREMSKGSPYALPWWYRHRFTLPADWKGQVVWLRFDQINYRANIWLNGKQIGKASEVVGAWRTFEFNVTDAVKVGGENVLAVEVFPQKAKDLGITFVDWNPTPPDKNMGLLREVSLEATGPVAIRYPAVFTKLNIPANDRAHLTVAAVVKNGSPRAVRGKLRGRIGRRVFEQDVALSPGEQKDVTFDPRRFAQLRVHKPRLWWPAQMGQPNLEKLELEFRVGAKVSDNAQSSFGIREVRSSMDDKQRLSFTINGKRLLIRGGGWSSDMMMRQDARREADQLRYLKDMGLNTVRLEGKLESDSFYDFTDRNGILVMAGWCCCDHWEKWEHWSPQDYTIAAESQRDQLYRLRGRPSVFVWLNASDKPPPAKVEKRYLEVAQQVRWPNPTLSSAADKVAEHSGRSGVKMWGPYEWVPPKYWLEDTRKGGAYGFNTETSPGPAIPVLESMRKMLPEDKLWPINEFWNFHAGGNQFKNVDVHTAALNARYGPASDLLDYTHKSQLMAYEGVRAMFEAFSRNKHAATGIIQWMLNNAWPGIIWHLFDYYLQPGGGYFGTKKACQPYLPLYSYTDGSIWAVNSTYRAKKGLKLHATVYDLDMTVRFSREAPLGLEADSTQEVLRIPAVRDLSPTYFLDLRIVDGKGQTVGSNFYWLSTKPETLAYERTDWFITPAKTYADFTALAKLPEVELESRLASRVKGGQGETTVTLRNPSRTLAFFVRLKLTKSQGGQEILPVFWEDNYVSLLPGESRTLTARYRKSDLGNEEPALELLGWNVNR